MSEGSDSNSGYTSSDKEGETSKVPPVEPGLVDSNGHISIVDNDSGFFGAQGQLGDVTSHDFFNKGDSEARLPKS